MRRNYDYCVVSFVLLIMAVVGCADDGMVDIAGQVSIDEAAVVKGTISFLPVDNRGASAEAVIKDGHYSVSVPRGEKRVAIHGFKKVGERFPWGKDNPPAEILEENVPKEFSEESALRLDANADNLDANFELTSSK